MGNVLALLVAPRGCTYTTSTRCFGAKQSGGPFCEETSVNYTYASCRSKLLITQRGIAKRVHRLSVSLFDNDRAASNDVVDAEVVVTTETSSTPITSCSSTMIIRRCNMAPHRGQLENWSQSYNSIEAIRYSTPSRRGMFSLTTTTNNSGTITHHFSTTDNVDGAGYSLEVKFKLEGSRGLRVHVDGPNFVPDISFTDRVQIQDSTTPVLHTSLPSHHSQNTSSTTQLSQPLANLNDDTPTSQNGDRPRLPDLQHTYHGNSGPHSKFTNAAHMYSGNSSGNTQLSQLLANLNDDTPTSQNGDRPRLPDLQHIYHGNSGPHSFFTNAGRMYSGNSSGNGSIHILYGQRL